MADAFAGTAAAAVSVTGLSKRYRDLVALDDVTLTAPRGSVTCLVGPNGSGKTTLVECVEGLRRPDRGRIEILGEEYPYGRKRPPGLGVQLQEESLPTRIRVGEALTFFRRLYQAPDLPQEWLATLGVDALWRRPFRQLSGGEKRRVAVALALVARPSAVVLDEPTANLDPDGQDAVMRVIGQLRAHHAGVLVSMHDMAHAARIADRVVVMVTGRIAAAGRPADLVASLPGSACVVLPAESTVPPRLRRQAEAEVVYRERRFLYGGEELLGFAALPDGAEARRASLVDVLARAAGTAAAREVGRVP